MGQEFTDAGKGGRYYNDKRKNHRVLVTAGKGSITLKKQSYRLSLLTSSETTGSWFSGISSTIRERVSRNLVSHYHNQGINLRFSSGIQKPLKHSSCFWACLRDYRLCPIPAWKRGLILRIGLSRLELEVYRFPSFRKYYNDS